MDNEYKKELTKRKIKSGGFISPEKAIEIINDRMYCTLVNDERTQKGDGVFFIIDNAKIDDGKLIFGRDNSSETISFILKDIKGGMFSEGESFFFIIKTDNEQDCNEEEWKIIFDEEIRTDYRNYEIFPEIGLDVFLKKLNGCEKASISIWERNMRIKARYDIVIVDDKPSWGDCQVRLALLPKRRNGTIFEIDLSDKTKFYLEHDDENYSTYNICLPEKPFFELHFTIYYPEGLN